MNTKHAGTHRLVLGLLLALPGALTAQNNDQDQDAPVMGPAAPGRARVPLWIHRGPGVTPGTTYDNNPWYMPNQVLHAYGFDLLGADGTGQVIGIVDAYGNQNIQFDLDYFCLICNLNPTSVTVVGSNPGGKGNGWDLETSLDVEWAHAVAPNAKIILSVAASGQFPDMLAAVQNAVGAGATVVSMSWGGAEGSPGENDSYFQAPGVTYVASSGDSGETYAQDWPAASPYVLGVGGTSLHLDLTTGNYSSETAWSDSGGGLSAVYLTPSWQAGWSSYLTTSRGVPDVSYVADPSTGLIVFCSTYSPGSAGWFAVGGTSAGAPQWAATIALANQWRSTPIGGTDPATGGNPIYTVAANPVGPINTGNFNDITSGSNGPDPDDQARAGYDLVTGLGTPVASGLVPALVALAPAAFSLSVTPASSGSEVYYGSGAFATYTVTVSPSSATLSSLSVSPPLNGASYSVVSPGTYTLTVNTSASTPVGYWPLTITGTSGSQSSATTATLAVLPFAFSVAPSSGTAYQGGTPASFTVTVTSYGWSGTVDLSLTGAPAGTTPGAGLVSSYTFPATATFPSTWTYPLSISAARTTPTGTSAPFIGASGDGFNINSTTPPSARVGDGLTQAAKVILKVSPSSGGGNFALAANPSSLAVKHGNSTSSTITVTPSGGFTSSVSLQATLSPSNGNGNPTISFGTNPVQAGSGASVMTVTTSSKTHTGKYDITVTGTSGSTRHSISVTLTVN